MHWVALGGVGLGWVVCLFDRLNCVVRVACWVVLPGFVGLRSNVLCVCSDELCCAVLGCSGLCVCGSVMSCVGSL